MPVGGDESKIYNLLLISIDTCRSDYLSCYGYPVITTPNIDRLARRGVRFERVYCQSSITLPSHCSMLTSLYPPAHGVRENGTFRLDESRETLAEIFARHGYYTGAVVSSFVLDSRFGLNQGFNEYLDEFEKPGSALYYFNDSWQGHKIDIFECSADEVTLKALRWLEQNAKTPFFLFLHYFDLHVPYSPPREYARKYKGDLYAGELAYVDKCIGSVLEYLEAAGLSERTVIVVTGDHGECLGEHDFRGHGAELYEQILKVPWVIVDPRIQTKGTVIKHPVNSIDIFPTILSLLKIPCPVDISGKGRTSLFVENHDNKSSDEGYSYAETLLPALRLGGAEKYVCVHKNMKLIKKIFPSGKVSMSLFDLSLDPGENINILEQSYPLAKTLERYIERIRDQGVYPRFKYRISVEDESRNKLKALGYFQ